MKQFLLNPDGSIPANVCLATLESEGIRLVMPTNPGAPPEGMIWQEQQPQQDEIGVWRQQWIAVDAPTPEPEPVPEMITAFQAKAALAQVGALHAVEAMIDSLPVDSLVKLAWNNQPHFRRASPEINAIGKELNLDLDALFRAGAAINI